jgi:hypothetical protein
MLTSASRINLRNNVANASSRQPDEAASRIYQFATLHDKAPGILDAVMVHDQGRPA